MTGRYKPATENIKLEVLRQKLEEFLADSESRLRQQQQKQDTETGKIVEEAIARTLGMVIAMVDIVGQTRVEAFPR